MKESDRGMFESEWESAFEGAEMAPSEKVWSKVEVAVANNEGKNYKRSLLFFKLLAAASVSFAMSIGGWQLYNNYYDQDNFFDSAAMQSANHEINIVDDEDNVSEQGVKQPLAVEPKGEVGNSNNSQEKKADLSKSMASNMNKISDKDMGFDAPLLASNESVSEDLTENIMSKDEDNLSALFAQNSIASPDKLEYLGIEFFAVNGKPAEPKMVPWLSNIQLSKKNDFKGFWAGVGMSAGSFNTNSNSSDAAVSLSEGIYNDNGNISSSSDLVSEESNGSAYSFGLNVGTQISKRFVLMSGLNYVQQSNTASSNVVALNADGFSAVDRNTSLSEVSSNTSYAYTESYKISNTYELLSVPVQAGYILLDRKFNNLLLSGVSNDIFLKQKITDESGRAQSVENSGSDNGYSTYSLSGLIGSEFSCDIGENYMLSLQPQLRQTINSFTPEGSKPTYFEVGFKFKYIIK